MSSATLAWGGENLTVGLAHVYRMEETSGGLIDTYPFTLNLSTTQGTARYRQTGKSNYSIYFPGSARMLSVANFNPNGTGTLCAWLYPNLTTRKTMGFAGYDGPGYNAGDWYLLRYLNGSNQYKMGIRTPNGVPTGTEYLIYTNTTTNNASWSLSCYEWSNLSTGVGGTRYWYNGSRLMGYQGSANTTPRRDQKFSLGGDAYATTPDFYWTGGIDEVYIWNRTLTANELAILYNNKTGTYWPFTDPSPDTTPPILAFTNKSVANATKVNQTFTNWINVSINETSLRNVTMDWNAANYTLFDNTTVLSIQADNVSALGETGTKIVDISQYTNNGILSGQTYINSTGKYSGSLQFDGTNDHINISDSSSLDFQKEFSICLWVLPRTSGITQRLLYKYDSTTNMGVFLSMQNSGTDLWQFTIYNGTGSANANGIEPYFNNWAHLCGVRENSSVMKLYQNGNLQALTGAINGTINSSNKMVLGADVNINWDFNGLLDNVQIYQRALSENEVKQMYYSNLEKKSSTEWFLTTNQTVTTKGNYTYSIHAADATSLKNWTGFRTWEYDTGQSNPGGADPCAPTIDADWTISTILTCINKQPNTGTGTTYITDTGQLILQDSNLTTARVSNAGRLVLDFTVKENFVRETG